MNHNCVQETILRIENEIRDFMRAKAVLVTILREREYEKRKKAKAADAAGGKR